VLSCQLPLATTLQVSLSSLSASRKPLSYRVRLNRISLAQFYMEDIWWRTSRKNNVYRACAGLHQNLFRNWANLYGGVRWRTVANRGATCVVSVATPGHALCCAQKIPLSILGAYGRIVGSCFSGALFSASLASVSGH